VKKAAKTSATAAVDIIRAKDELRDEEKRDLLSKVDTLKKADDKVTLSPQNAIKKAVKTAVLKQKSDDPSVNKYDHAELMAAIKGLSATPASNGLNARASAGIDIAHQILDHTAGVNGEGIISEMVKRRGIKGLTKSGLLDEDDDED